MAPRLDPRVRGQQPSQEGSRRHEPAARNRGHSLCPRPLVFAEDPITACRRAVADFDGREPHFDLLRGYLRPSRQWNQPGVEPSLQRIPPLMSETVVGAPADGKKGSEDWQQPTDDLAVAEAPAAASLAWADRTGQTCAQRTSLGARAASGAPFDEGNPRVRLDGRGEETWRREPEEPESCFKTRESSPPRATLPPKAKSASPPPKPAKRCRQGRQVQD